MRANLGKRFVSGCRNHELSPIIRPEAEHDLADARDWYDEQRNGLGHEFLATVDQTLIAISMMPLLYAVEYKSVRRVCMQRFPYVVYYRVIGDVVEILGVLHGNRNPAVWKSRAK